MTPLLKAEWRKIITVRSTYVIVALLWALAAGLMSLWAHGYKDVEHAASQPIALQSTLLVTASIAGVFLSFIAILQVGHEYRYNTILYTLTSANNRLKVLFAKWLMVVVFTAIAAVLTMLLAGVGFYAGQHVAGIATMHQTMPSSDLLWRAAVSIVGTVTLGFIIALLLRSLVAAFVVMLVLPSTVEPILTLLIKDNSKYLPFTALDTLIGSDASHAVVVRSLYTVLSYVVILGVAAALLFSRRDAN